MTGERIREYRKKHRYSQKQLADMIGVAQTSVSGWETGARSITLDDLLLVARALQEPISNFLPEGTEESGITNESVLAYIDKMDHDLPRAISEYPEIHELDNKLDVELYEVIWSMEKAVDEMVNDRLSKVSESFLLDRVVSIFRELNKAGQYELYKHAQELDDVRYLKKRKRKNFDEE